MKHKVTVGCFGIISDEKDRVLLCHRLDYDLWNLPGGGLEKDESPWDCVIREVKEETGLDVEVVKLIGVYSKPGRNDIVFSFECKIVGGEVALNDEADKIEYFVLSKFPENTLPKQVERVRDYFEHHSSSRLKIQEGKPALELVKDGKL